MRPTILLHLQAQPQLAKYMQHIKHIRNSRGGPGGWWSLPEVDVRLARHQIVRPDVAGWRRERLPEPWDVRPIDVVPDWICEVVLSLRSPPPRPVFLVVAPCDAGKSLEPLGSSNCSVI
jgi:hypothetical protein